MTAEPLGWSMNDAAVAEIGNPAVVVDGLCVTRGTRKALWNVSLSIARGRITGLLGPSGSGKTTLLRSIVGSQIVTRGTVTVFGIPAGSATLRRRVAYMTQSLGVYDDLTVRENVAFYAQILRLPAERADEVIEAVGLLRHRDQIAGELLDGQRARVSLATAFLAKPELLVLDEPTASLDPILRREIRSLLGRLASAGATVLVSSHVMEEATHCDHLLLLNEGALVASGTPDELCRLTQAKNVEGAFLTLLERTA